MSKTKLIARTAVLVALAIVFQNLRYLIGTLPYSTLIIGSLVNLTIIVATGYVGLLSGIAVCLITPIVAFYQGHLPHVFLAPVTMLGNSVLAVVFCLFIQSKFKNPLNMILGVIFGALIKWGAMYWLGVKVVLNLFVSNIPAQKAAAIAVSFNTPQAITALIGGVLGILVLNALKNNSNTSV